MAEKKKSLKNSHWPLSVLGSVTSILNALLPLSLVRVLTVEEIGRYKLFFFYVTMIPLFALTAGVTNGLFYWAGQDKKREAAFRASWTMILLVSIGVLALGIGLHPELTHKLGWTPTQTWLMVWTAFLTLTSSFYEDTQVASGEIWRGGIFSSSFEVLRNVTIVVMAIHYRTVDSVMWSYAVMMTLKLILGVGLGRMRGFQKLIFESGIWKGVIRYGAPVSLGGLLSVFTGYGDQLVLSALLSAADFGVYSLGCLTVQPLTIFEISVNRVLIPNMASAFARQEPHRARALYRQSVSELSWLFVPAVIALCQFATPIVLLLFKQKFIAAAPFLHVYAFYYLASIIPYDAVPRARGMGGWILRFLGIFAPIAMAAIYIGARMHGAMGALFGLIFGQYLMRSASVVWVARTEGWKISEMLPWSDLGRYFAISLVAAAAAEVVHYWVRSPILWFFTGGTVYSFIYLATTMRHLFRQRARAAERPTVLLLSCTGGDELSARLERGGKWTPLAMKLEPRQNALLRVFKLLKVVLFSKVAVVHSEDGLSQRYALVLRLLTFGAVKLAHAEPGYEAVLT